MGKDYVFELQIAVNDFMLMHVLHSCYNLPGDHGGSLLAEALLGLEEFEKRPVACQLQQKVEIVLICEEIVQADQVGMVQKCLHLHLPHQLRHRFCVLFSIPAEKIRFPNHFQSGNKASSSMPVSINIYLTR